MTQKTSTTLTPKLRFPMFRDARGWKEKGLGSQGDFLSSLSGKTGKDFDTGDAKFITYMNVFSNVFTDKEDLRSVDVEAGESQNAVAKGDVFFTVSSETPEETGMSSVLLEDIDNCYLNSFCALFRFDEGKLPEPVFLGYMLRSAIPREHLAKSAQGSTRFNLSKGTFKAVPLLLPDPAEQQKIADCLGSLDDWIAAAGRRLAALREHKRGLMQQLFPQPGQSQPQQRLPEFRNRGEWKEDSLAKLCTAPISYGIVQAGPHVPDGMPYIKSTDLNSPLCLGNLSRTSDEIAKKYRRSEVSPGDIVFSLRGNIGVSQIIPKEIKVSNLTQGTARIRTKGLPEFYIQALASQAVLDKILAVSKGSTLQEISLDDLRKIQLRSPEPKEQQKIAACLTALDTQITAQADQIESLKQHKCGLMQQLFPAPEGGIR